MQRLRELVSSNDNMRYRAANHTVPPSCARGPAAHQLLDSGEVFVLDLPAHVVLVLLNPVVVATLVLDLLDHSV